MYRHTASKLSQLLPLVLILAFFPHSGTGESNADVKQPTWAETLMGFLQASRATPTPEEQIAFMCRLENDFPEQWDWMLQDSQDRLELWLDREKLAMSLMLGKVLADAGPAGLELKKQADQYQQLGIPSLDPRWLALYEKACLVRREYRLQTLWKSPAPIVFTKHYNLGGSHYAYTEGLSDAQHERHFVPGTALCVLELKGATARIKTLLEDQKGVIRDPAVSYDGSKILFSWKKSDREDDYHLYEMEVATGKIRQLTFGLGFADYEGTYLPNGNILFNSTRCIQAVDCWFTEVSNLYTCDKDGKFLRRITYDQVHDNYPTVTNDGRVIYTRWEYNDRGQLFPQPLFQMNPDGTGQTEAYGNNSWFPTAILHARAIPGSDKYLGIISGHHTLQTGKLGLIDPSKGRQEASGIQLLAPIRETKAERIDQYGQDGDQFQYPWPLSEEACLVSYHPAPQLSKKSKKTLRYKLYLMGSNGQRELLVSDAAISCNQPVALAARPVPIQRATTVDYQKSFGTFSMQNIYAGQALPGVKPGTVKKLRVVALDFRAAAIKGNGNHGPAGGAIVSTPSAIDNGTWDPKVVLGDATVYEDGSAFFQAPAATPLYFIALDEKGHMVQTMRSWATLQPGENASCIGCHEDKNAPALAARTISQAVRAGAQPLVPFYGPARPFRFTAEIQPILNRSCIQCHQGGLRESFDPQHPAAPALKEPVAQNLSRFGLTGSPVPDGRSGRVWSEAYINLTSKGKSSDLINWVSPQSAPPMLAPFSAGSSCSKLFEFLENGHYNVKLTQEEKDKLACWIDLLVPFCGDYTEATFWSEAESQRYDYYVQKRRRMQETEHANIEALLASQNGTRPAIQIQVIAENGNVLPPGSPITHGARIEVTGPAYLVVRPSPNLPECLVYSPQGRVTFPEPSNSDPYLPALLEGKSDWSARAARPEEIGAYRNLALNPYDIRGVSTFFPHATSNSECRNSPHFAARNAIDGCTENRSHGGWPHQSWGPDKRTDLWWRVDFGCEVEVDKLVLYIRADFPHDTAWTGATIRFSDGSTEKIQILKQAEPQTYQFAKRKVSWVQLEDFQQPNPSGWNALTEVQVWGRALTEGTKSPTP